MFNSVLNKHAPLQKLYRKQKQLNGKSWLSKDILISIKTKHKLFQNMTKTKTEKDKKTISKILKQIYTYYTTGQKKTLY